MPAAPPVFSVGQDNAPPAGTGNADQPARFATGES
jgi:hypothetical protein